MSISISKIKFWGVIASTIGLGAVFLYLVATEFLTPRPKAEHPWGVQAAGEYEAPAKAAMSLWNSFSRCEFLITGGSNITIKAADGEACGHEIGGDPGNALTYQCSGERFEVVVQYPGDLHHQTWILTEAIGRTLGNFESVLPHEDGKSITIRDEAAKAARERFCK